MSIIFSASMNTIKIIALSSTCLEIFKYRSIIKVGTVEDSESLLCFIHRDRLNEVFVQNMEVMIFFNKKITII